MQFKYGSYSHNENDVSAIWRREPLMSDGGVQIGYKLVCSMNGRLRGDTQSEVTANAQALLDAYSENGKDLILYDNSSAESVVKVVESGSETGVLVKDIQIPGLKDAQYTTYLDYAITVESEYVTNRVLYETFTNSLTVKGNGGPINVLIPGVNQITPQQTRPFSPVVATESGQATRTGAVAPFPPPMFPGLLINEQQARTVETKTMGGKAIYVIRWNYQYQSTSQISGVPVPLGLA